MERHEKDTNSRLLMFDGHALAFHSWFTSIPSRVTSGFFDLFTEAIEKYTPTHVVVTFDPAPPTFRHLIFPKYKGNRPPVPEGLLEECDEVRNTLQAQGIQSISVAGYEADDVLGTLSKQASTVGFEVVIITCDLDLLQLVSNSIKVEVFSQYWATRVFGVDAAKRRFGGLEIASIPDYKALVGDKSDNYPGIRGIGDRTALTLLSKFGHLEGIYDNLENVCELPLRGAKRVYQLLNDNREYVFMMRTLATINSDVFPDQEYDLGMMKYPEQLYQSTYAPA